MPRLYPRPIFIDRNLTLVIKDLLAGNLLPPIQGGEYGKRIWLLPWQDVSATVFTGFSTIQVLRGSRRLHFAGGGWIDFQEAVLTTQVLDVLKAAYDHRYEHAENFTMLRGIDGTEALMRANIDDVIQSYMAGKRLEEAIYLSGAEITENVNLAVPNPGVHPAFAGITTTTGVAMFLLRFSGVILSDNYVQTMEEIKLNTERLGVVKQERQDLLQFLRNMVATDPEHEPTTITQAAEIFQKLSFGEMLQNLSGQLMVAGSAHMALLLPYLMQMMQGTYTYRAQPQNQRTRRRRSDRNQQQGNQDQGAEDEE